MRAPRPSSAESSRRDARRTIRYKLILLVMTPLSMAVALIAGISTWRDATGAVTAEQARLAASAQMVAAFAGHAVEAGDRPGALAALHTITRWSLWSTAAS
jgi:hypothetical protein